MEIWNEYVNYYSPPFSDTELIHNGRFIRNLKKTCQSKTFKNGDFWNHVKTVGRSLSLISEDEGVSDVSEIVAIRVRTFSPIFYQKLTHTNHSSSRTKIVCIVFGSYIYTRIDHFVQ